MPVKITYLKSKNPAPSCVIVCIPGGPGLSSQTIRGLDPLQDQFDLAYVDMIAETPDEAKYDVLFSDLLRQVQESNLPVVGLGHSFGGFFASELVLKLYEQKRDKVHALICLSTPFSEKTIEETGKQYEKHMTPKLRSAEQEWEMNPSRQTFNQWLASYDSLYFTDEWIQRGNAMLMSDNSYPLIFLDSVDVANQKIKMLSEIEKINFKKLFVAGEKELLIPVDSLCADSDNGNFEFHKIKGCSHFTMLENSHEVCRIIENFINTTPKEEGK